MPAALNKKISIKNTLFVLLFLMISCQNDEHIVVPGSAPLSYMVEDATYTSSVIANTPRKIKVCLPSDYNKLQINLPVLYLLHGGQGDENSWIDYGWIVQKLTARYKEGIIFPMVVVTVANMDIGSDYRSPGLGSAEGDRYVQEFVKDLIPFIESKYQVSTQRKDRAVAGLSAGGIQTLNLALFHPEKFGYVYPLSAAYFEEALDTLNSGKYDDVLANPQINQFRKFILYCGSEDGIFYAAGDAENSLLVRTLQLFDDHNINYQSVVDAGYIHSWDYWQLCFDRFVTTLFQE